MYGKTLLGDVNKLFSFQKFVDNAQQRFAITPQANFPAHNLNFHWKWRCWDWIQATSWFSYKYYKHIQTTNFLVEMLTLKFYTPFSWSNPLQEKRVDFHLRIELLLQQQQDQQTGQGFFGPWHCNVGKKEKNTMLGNTWAWWKNVVVLNYHCL